MANKHEAIERNVFLLIVLTLLAVSVGGLVEIVPLFFQKSLTVTQGTDGKPLVVDDQGNPIVVKPYEPLRLVGRDVYIREGCYNCHSQMIRPFRAETERYGHYSVAGEFVYDHPFQWGSKRTGPDLARVGGRYTDEWQRAHLLDPRSVVPESNMPAFPWLDREVGADDVSDRMKALRVVGVPYTDDEIAKAPQALLNPVTGRKYTELDAVIAYLQGMGTAIRNVR
jgi:cytochrome c oxidase cbb3-type subunit 2